MILDLIMNIVHSIKERMKKQMKKLWNTAFGYFLAAMAAGVFYREFTKFNDFTRRTTLAFTHVHLMVLGTMVFLFLGLAAKVTNLMKQKGFHKSYIIYNVALPFMMVVMIVRGIFQTLGTELSRGADAAISGIAGLTHIAIAGALIYLFTILRKTE